MLLAPPFATYRYWLEGSIATARGPGPVDTSELGSTVNTPLVVSSVYTDTVAAFWLATYTVPIDAISMGPTVTEDGMAPVANGEPATAVSTPPAVMANAETLPVVPLVA